MLAAITHHHHSSRLVWLLLLQISFLSVCTISESAKLGLPFTSLGNKGGGENKKSGKSQHVDSLITPKAMSENKSGVQIKIVEKENTMKKKRRTKRHAPTSKGFKKNTLTTGQKMSNFQKRRVGVTLAPQLMPHNDNEYLWEFYTDNNDHCEQMEPVVQRLENDLKTKVKRMNVFRRKGAPQAQHSNTPLALFPGHFNHFSSYHYYHYYSFFYRLYHCKSD